MVAIRPFRALRYAGVPPEKMGDVTSPPYDVFTPEMQRAFYDRHPHNVVRLIQGEVMEGEEGGTDEGRIGRAARYIAQWREEGVLASDPRPALYPYRQRFALPDGTRLERRSFFAAVRLERYAEGDIHPHERTFSKPKGFLFRLWGRCGAHLGPVFGFYEEPSEAAASALAACAEGEPVADFEEDGVQHALWRCEAPEGIRAVQEALARREVFIADGHHRYETSLDLRDAARKVGAPLEGEADYTLMCLASAADPGMAILPTHRLLKRVAASVGHALPRLAASYEVIEEPAPAESAGWVASRRLRSLADGRVRRTAFCLYDGKGPLRYLLRNEGAPGSAAGALEEAVSALDVSRLHAEVIEAAFAASHDEADIGFTPDPEAALAAVRAGACAVALLLNPTPIEAVCRIARTGGRMPHKSTYFYPKLRTGLVIHAFAPPAAG